MRAHLVAKADCVDIIVVSRNAQDTSLGLQIINVDAFIARASHDLAPITTETQTPDAKMAATSAPAASTARTMPTTSHIREI